MRLTPIEGQSVADYLIRIMPGLEINLRPAKDMIDPLAASSLFVLWKDGGKVSDSVYIRPTTMSAHQIEAMTKAGLTREMGDRLEITDKGGKILKVMILANDSSIFDSEETVLSYNEAMAKIKKGGSSKSRVNKTADSWWRRFEKIAEGSSWRNETTKVSIIRYDEQTKVVTAQSDKSVLFYHIDDFLTQYKPD
jgi:hypothetical protein